MNEHTITFDVINIPEIDSRQSGVGDIGLECSCGWTKAFDFGVELDDLSAAATEHVSPKG